MRRLIALLVALSTLVACGSTVADTQRQTAEGAARAGDGVDVATGDTLAGDATGTTTASGVATGRSSSGARRGATSSGRSTASGSTAVGPGVSATSINIGAAYAVNSGAANAALGATGITAGDPKRTTEIVVEDINSTGGVAGRKLVPVWHEVDGATTAPLSVIQQQECDTWTEDNKVFAAFAAGGDTILQCLHNRGVVQVSDDLSGAGEATFARYPYYFDIGSINLDRLARVEAAALQTQKYFTGWDAALGRSSGSPVKVGVVTFDDPSFNHAIDANLVPALRKLGVAPAPEDIRRIPPNERPADPSPQAAAASSAVLKLRSDGVTHVIIFEERGLLSLLFMQAAEAQGYRPRYGVNSQNGPQALADGSGLPKKQLVGALGIGWLPSLDLQPAQNTINGPYANDQRKRCIRLLTSKGQTFSDANAESIAMGICSSLWFFRDAVKQSGNVLNRAGFAAGVAKLGTSFLTTGNFANRFTATQHDGVAAVRFYAYDPATQTMKYTSGNVGV